MLRKYELCYIFIIEILDLISTVAPSPITQTGKVQHHQQQNYIDNRQYCRCVTNFQSYCPDGSSRTLTISRTCPAGPDQYRTPKMFAVTLSSLFPYLCYKLLRLCTLAVICL